MGPISPPSSLGNRFVLTLSDYFTKWVEAVALPTKEAHGVATVLLKVTSLYPSQMLILLYNYIQIFMRMGLPKLLTSDQGGEFRSDLDKEMMSLLGIKRHLVTPYHPQVH